VLDSNLVLSALVFRGGAGAALRQAWQQGACVPLVSAVTLTELIRVLSYPKFRLAPEEQHELLADYLPYAQTIQIHKPVQPLPRCRDPHDLPFLHLALAGRADALVSGDKDLLILADEFPVPILSLSQFLGCLPGRP
jgi:putative PIN family toxin of toxin-antitoxin system